MVLKDVVVTYEGCEYCKSSCCLTSYQPNAFISLRALKIGLKRSCNKCGATLIIRCVKAKMVKGS